MILSDQGVPYAPSDIVTRLRQVNPRLGLLWRNGWNGAHWALVMEWDESDRRRSRVRSGELAPDEAHDILAFLPPDCSADQAYGYLVNAFRASSEENTRKLLDRVHTYNDNVLKAHEESALSDALNWAEVRGRNLVVDGPAKVYQS